MELTMLPPEKEIEVKPLDDERAAVFVFTEMTQVSKQASRPASCLVANCSSPPDLTESDPFSSYS